jgi:serine protease
MMRQLRRLGIALAVMLPLGVLGGPPASADEAPREVLGLIVQKASSSTGARSARPALEVVDFAEPMTAAEALPLAAALEELSGVLAVEPNVRVYPAESPVIPDDPLFGQQWDMWNGGGSGDYGTRAALLWNTTLGDPGVVVGVIDTGYTAHPDLAGTTVPGFDFISDAVAARDGNRWDSDPADQGDWCPEDSSSSTWHGTHVAGTVNALWDNGTGVAGLAPDVRVQHLRVLGECGGSSFDILAAALWGAGGDLSAQFSPFPGEDPGINPTPASVLNLSLGGELECGAISQQIFSQVRALGATVVAAAGNEATSVTSSWPANCPGVVSVASSTRSGTLSSFSNFGTAPGQLTITAPGGGIVSTYNTGSTVPVSPNYASVSGTSMATPHVSAGAAVLYGFGVTNPSAVEAALKGSVTPFPAGSSCDVVRCGAGLLDVSKLQAFAPGTDPGAPTNVRAAVGDSRATVSWTPPVETGGSGLVSATAVASPGGATCTTAATSCEITGLTNGTAYTVAVTVTNAAGRTGPPAVSAPFTPGSVTVPGKVSSFSKGRYSGSSPSLRVTVSWRPPADDGGSPIIRYRVRYGTGGKWKSWVSVDSPSYRLNGMRGGKKYTVQVRAVNAVGGGDRASYSFTTPKS